MNTQELQQDAVNKVVAWRVEHGPSFAQYASVVTDDNSTSTMGMMCAYRTPEGNKCDIGVLMPDGQYDAIIERISVSEIVQGSIERFKQATSPEIVEKIQGVLDVLRGTFEPYGLNFLFMLQCCHDCATDFDDVMTDQAAHFDAEFYIDEVTRLCKRYDLDVPDGIDGVRKWHTQEESDDK